MAHIRQQASAYSVPLEGSRVMTAPHVRVARLIMILCGTAQQVAHACVVQQEGSRIRSAQAVMFVWGSTRRMAVSVWTAILALVQRKTDAVVRHAQD